MADNPKFEVFQSQYTGEEVERALQAALDNQTVIRDNIAPPEATFTGDFTEVAITTLTQSSYLSQIIVTCKKAFSKSVHNHTYQIRTPYRSLIDLSTAFMQDEGATLIYHFNETFPATTRFYISASSVQAYGEITVKCVFA